MKTKWKPPNKKNILETQDTSDGKQDRNIENRIARAWSYFAEIRALINKFPLGKEKQKWV